MKVIIRIDDVTGHYLRIISNYFLKYHSDVPVCIFAMKTNSDWSLDDWKLMKYLITKYNWEIGGHTRNHLILPLLSDKEIINEIVGNIRDIEENLRRVGLQYKAYSFAYPHGEYDERVIKILKEVGIKFGITYPDAYPYTSVRYIPSLKEKNYIIGITHHGEPANLELYNERFRRAIKTEIYILTVHPYIWEVKLSNLLLDYFLRRRTLSSLIRGLYFGLLKKPNSLNLAILDKHLNYIKSHDVEFTTVRNLIEEEV